MSNIIEEYERNGLTITIEEDMNPESPREWDNLGTMICSHRKYTLGDEQFDSSEYENWADLEKHLREDRGAVVVLPLGLYDHSGITMYVGSSHDRWDGGQVGFIYATAEELEHEYPGDNGLNSMEAYLRNEVKTYDQYLTGDVYGYTITDNKTNKEVDSLWGLYGMNYAKQEANSEADLYNHPRESSLAKNAHQMHR